MPASTIATDVRGAIKTALAGCTANIYDSVPEAPIVPAIVVVPDAPYMELEVLGKSTTAKPSEETFNVPPFKSLLAAKIPLKYFAEKLIGSISSSLEVQSISIEILFEFVFE